MAKPVKLAKCNKCGKLFRMGYEGITNGKRGRSGDVCDNCAGVQRDTNGYAWQPGETEHTYLVIETGATYTITREQAFNVSMLRLQP